MADAWPPGAEDDGVAGDQGGLRGDGARGIHGPDIRGDVYRVRVGRAPWEDCRLRGLLGVGRHVDGNGKPSFSNNSAGIFPLSLTADKVVTY